MKRNRVLLLVALVATWSGFSRYSAGGGVDAAEATKGTGVNTEVPHLPEGTAQDGENHPITTAAAAALYALKAAYTATGVRGWCLLQRVSMCPACPCSCR